MKFYITQEYLDHIKENNSIDLNNKTTNNSKEFYIKHIENGFHEVIQINKSIMYNKMIDNDMKLETIIKSSYSYSWVSDLNIDSNSIFKNNSKLYLNNAITTASTNIVDTNYCTKMGLSINSYPFETNYPSDGNNIFININDFNKEDGIKDKFILKIPPPDIYYSEKDEDLIGTIFKWNDLLDDVSRIHVIDNKYKNIYFSDMSISDQFYFEDCLLNMFESSYSSIFDEINLIYESKSDSINAKNIKYNKKYSEKNKIVINHMIDMLNDLSNYANKNLREYIKDDFYVIYNYTNIQTSLKIVQPNKELFFISPNNDMIRRFVQYFVL